MGWIRFFMIWNSSFSSKRRSLPLSHLAPLADSSPAWGAFSEANSKNPPLAGFYPSVISLRSLTAPLLGGHFRKLDVPRSARTNIEDLASGSLAHIARRAVRDGEAKTIRRNRPS